MRANCLFSCFSKMFNSSVAPADALAVENDDVANKGKPIDVNRYATKKTVAQGMLDIALLTANASQLKYILQTGDKLEFYALLLWLITTSIILQKNKHLYINCAVNETAELVFYYLRRRLLHSPKIPSKLVQLTSVLDIISTSSSAVAQNLSILANEVLQFVNDGGEIVDSYGQHEEIILVLGNAQSGKSTFTSYMADEMEYLYVRRTRGENTLYTIRDSRNKLKREDAATQQVIPRLVEDYRLKRTYFDCPAFGSPHSDVSVHFLRKVVATAKFVKMVFVVDYEWVKASSPSAPFLGVVAGATDMSRVGKFLAAVALVVTKVDNEQACGSDDEVVDKEISVFLSRVRDELSASQDKDGVAFVNTLLERNREGSFTRIGLFRNPDRAGPLKYSKRLRESRPRLDATIHENIKFVKRDPSDTVFSRPDMHEAYANELVRQAQENIRNGVRYIADDIRKHYIWREKISDDVIALQDLFQNGTQLFSKAIEVESMAAFIANVKKIARTTNILISAKNVMAVRRYNEFLDYLCSEPDASTGCARVFVTRSKPYNWNQSMLVTVNYLNDSKTWYEFLIRLIERLSAYDVKRDLTLPLEVTVDDLRRLHKQSLGSPLPESIETMKVDKLKLRFLKPILSVAFYKPLVSVARNTLTVQGAFVKLSDVVKLAAFTNPKTKTVRIFALSTVFLDAHVDLTGREMTVLILAPTWKFVCDSHFLLDGQAGRGHNTTQSTAGPSTAGLPGKAGGPAGHFFGIGSTFVSLPSVLRIEANGGNGGSGQCGCPGLRGQHGEDCLPLQPGKWWAKGWHRRRFLGKSKYPGYRKELREGDSLYFHNATTSSTKYIRVLGVKVPVKCRTYHYNCTGQIGREGSKGGGGGAGGKGGLMGTVELIDITNRVVFNCTKSADGCLGTPGSGSAGGCRGDQGISYATTFEEYRTPFAIYYRRPGVQNLPVEPSAEPCRKDDGIPGGNSKNMECPRRYDFANPIRNVVDYKKVAREYALQAQINPLNAPINTFISLIEADARVNVYDHTRAFIYDLFALENQFYSLHTKTSILTCYESLARRILLYAGNANGRLSATDKVILSHVYSAVLSKISALKRNRNFLVMDFDRYCKSVLTEIKNLNKLNHIEMINEYKIKYENMMNRKIDEARRFIDEIIIPTIEGSFKNTGETIQMLLDENDDYKQNARDYEIEVKKVMRQLKSTLVVRRTLSVMLFGAQFLQFLGPVGAIVGPAVQGASMVAISLISPNMDKLKKARAKNMAQVHATLLKNSELLESHRVRLRNEMTYITQEVKKAEERQSADLTFLKVEIEKHEQRLKELETRQDEVVPFWILTRVQDEFKARMNKLLESKEKEYDLAQNSMKADKNASNQMDAVIRVKRVIRISADIIDLITVGNKQGDEIDLERLESELDQVGLQLTRLHNYEKMITDVFVPLCDKVYTEIRNWQKGLHKQSPASLRMSQWNVHDSLKTIKKTLKDMTDSYKTQNVIMESIDQIEEGLTMLIDMYDHIQKYHEKVELEAYIANVNSYREKGPLNDPEIDRLNVLMRSNVILNLFNNAMDAFKQAIFPFAHLYFEDMGTLPDSLRIENNTDVLVKEAISRINNLNEKIRQVSSQLYDLYDNAIMKDVPFTLDRSLTPPFYEWDFKANEYVIQKLLSGSTVTLTSHITKTRVDDNAVKFKNLRIRLILTAHTNQQAKFDQLLENYIFELTHSGEMYFRCGRRFYFVRCNSMKMTFSFKSKANGEPESANSIYGRIKDNYYALSPYTTWNVKLVKNKYWTGDIGALGKFASYPMKIVLEGLGEYVKRDIDHEICNANLSKYYESITL